MVYYAHMGIREYWILDKKADPRLTGYRSLPEGGFNLRTQFEAIPADSSGLRSEVLDGYLNWQDESLLYRQNSGDAWQSLEAMERAEGQVDGVLRVLSAQLREALEEVDPATVAYILAQWTTQLPDPLPSLADWSRLQDDPHHWREILPENDIPPDETP